MRNNKRWFWGVLILAIFGLSTAAFGSEADIKIPPLDAVKFAGLGGVTRREPGLADPDLALGFQLADGLSVSHAALSSPGHRAANVLCLRQLRGKRPQPASSAGPARRAASEALDSGT